MSVRDLRTEGNKQAGGGTGLLAGKEQGRLALGITDSGVSVATGSDGVSDGPGHVVPGGGVPW